MYIHKPQDCEQSMEMVGCTYVTPGIPLHISTYPTPHILVSDFIPHIPLQSTYPTALHIPQSTLRNPLHISTYLTSLHVSDCTQDTAVFVTQILGKTGALRIPPALTALNRFRIFINIYI